LVNTIYYNERYGEKSLQRKISKRLRIFYSTCAEATISIGNDWYSLVFITNVYIDMQKTADMIRPKNYTFEEISEELKAEVVASIKDE